jgi:hypothetical protein
MNSLKEYKSLLKSGMFFEFFPQLTGNWEDDKDEFEKIINNKNNK